jgi:hypothetical protein
MRDAGMPSAKYYIEQAKALLSWATATRDETKAACLRAQAAKELERAKEAQDPAEVLNSAVSEFNERKMLNKDDIKRDEGQ